MPGMGGEVAIQILRRINPQVKIIASSGITSNKSQLETAGVKAFLYKPYAIQELLSTLHEVLSKKKLD